MRSEPLLILLLILSAPLNHAGRNSTVIWGVNRQGCRFSRPAPWMARGGGPPNRCRITGTPSLSEVPSGGARAFCLILRFSKVRRRKGGTHSSRYRSNGYVLALIQHPGRLSGRHREQVESSHRPSHIWIARHQSDSYRPPSRHGSKLPRHRFRATPKLCRYLCSSGASPLPQLIAYTRKAYARLSVAQPRGRNTSASS
ncbi:Threonine synthase [Pseudomonas sp. R2-60-08W]|nr:Threonine synthase [Pseudomonas sp. R2-60-08W]